MRRLLFEIAYQGTRYHGYQVQANALTVAQVVQDAVEKVFGRREGITGCSRTDAGDHAGQYFFHMDTGSRIPVDGAVRAMNVNLPGDIAVLSCREVPSSFHARYSVVWKEYTYKIWNAPVRSPFYDGLMLMHPYPLDEALMDRCAKEFIGTHDFRGFCSTGSKAKPTILDGGESTVRTVFAASVRREGDVVLFTVRGDGFLYNMVRIMAGTLLLTGLGRLEPGDLTEIIKSGDRTRAGVTAPAAGLYLTRVSYTPYGQKEGVLDG